MADVQIRGSIVITIRDYVAADYTAVKEIYRSAICQLGAACYSPAQVHAWAGHADDDIAFAAWLDASIILVAVDDNAAVLGFGGLERPARISCLFVAPRSARKGVGSALVEHLLSLEPSQSGYTTEASELSKPLFEKFGFRVVEVEQTEVNNVTFARFRMHKRA